jgi:hypothetical protein
MTFEMQLSFIETALTAAFRDPCSQSSSGRWTFFKNTLA